MFSTFLHWCVDSQRPPSPLHAAVSHACHSFIRVHAYCAPTWVSGKETRVDAWCVAKQPSLSPHIECHGPRTFWRTGVCLSKSPPVVLPCPHMAVRARDQTVRTIPVACGLWSPAWTSWTSRHCTRCRSGAACLCSSIPGPEREVWMDAGAE